jgi:hypothetical protein
LVGPSRQSHLGWQPSRFLTDRAEAEHAFALAEQLGSVNAAAKELGTTWPSLRKAFGRHGLGMPTPLPHRPIRPHQPVPATPEAGYGGPCPLTPPARPPGQQTAVPLLMSSLMSLVQAQGGAGL